MPYINNSWSLKEFKGELKKLINSARKEHDNAKGPSYVAPNSDPVSAPLCGKLRRTFPVVQS